MKRRRALALLGVGLAGGGVAGTGAAALRLHRAPRREPYLTDAHLARVAQGNLARPRVLVMGNSMVLRNDLPFAVGIAAARDGVSLSVAAAAGEGARLIETIRIPALAAALGVGWDAVVVQDFTKTPLRVIDRWASAWAVSRIAQLAAPSPLLLFPPWPAAPGNAVYRDPGFLTARPDNPEDYAARTMDFYGSLGHPAAPVPRAWLDAVAEGRQVYAEDGHHPSAEGTSLVADTLWGELRKMIRAA